MAGTGVIDSFLGVFTSYIDSGFGLLGGEVAFIATTLIVIDVTLAALFWAWGADEDIITRLVKKTLFVGVFAYLIGNWNSLAQIIFDSFAGLGLQASGTGFSVSDLMRPGRVAQTGLDAGRPLLESISELMGYWSFFENFIQIICLLFAWALVLLAFFILAVQLFVTLIEFKLTTLAGFVLIPFGLFGKSAFMAERVLGNVISSGIKVLVLAVIIGIGSTLPAVAVSTGDATPPPMLVPPGWTPAKGGDPASTPTARVENANDAARVEPRREGYFNAIQIYPWSEGALYQVYAAVGQITSIALVPGESLTGAGPIAAGDTTRWIIGDTESGSGATRRVHVLVKPTRADITTNLVITTDRRTYMIELRAGEKPYMPAVAWAYPQVASQRSNVPAAPIIPAVAARNYRYGLVGDTPPWRPVSVYDDGRRVYVEFPRGIVQGEMPPIFVIGPNGEAEIVNSRVHNNVLIVDRLFGAAELRLGSGNRQQTVRIVRTDGRSST